jgi:MerR family mercuric resistance operon transcriptional regulator
MHPITVSRADGVPIGALSRLAGVNIETIRYYEKIGMLPAPLHTAGGHRVYGPNETHIFGFIRRGRELGFTLDEIRVLLNFSGPEKASCAEVSKIARRHLEIRPRQDRGPSQARSPAEQYGRAMFGQEGTELPRSGYSRILEVSALGP